MAKALAYYDTAAITDVKSFIVQAPGVWKKKVFFCWKNIEPIFQVRFWMEMCWGFSYKNFHTSGLYYKRVTIVIDAPSVNKVTLQIVASLTIEIDNAS